MLEKNKPGGGYGALGGATNGSEQPHEKKRKMSILHDKLLAEQSDEIVKLKNILWFPPLHYENHILEETFKSCYMRRVSSKQR